MVERLFCWMRSYSLEDNSICYFCGPFGRKEIIEFFKGSSSTSAELISKITSTIAKWALGKKEFSNFCLHDILINWESYLGCDPVKVRKSIL